MFELIESMPDCNMYRWHSLMFAVHWREFRKTHFDTIGEMCDRIRDDHGSMSSIVVLRGNFRLTLDHDARQAGAELTKHCEPFNLGQALVIEADGFKSSIARSLLTGINLMVRSKAEQRVFKDPEEGARWVCALERQHEPVRAAANDVWGAIDGLLRELPREAEPS